MSARYSYDSELASLVAALIRMGAAATGAIDKAMEAFRTHDRDLARQVMRGDDAINAMERDIEQMCLTLLLRQQPVAGDLRRVSAAIKMITDIERIGDAAADIADISRHIEHEGMPPVAEDIEGMAEEAQKMVIDAINAYASSDLALARQVMERDDKVDQCFASIRSELAALIAQDPRHAAAALDYLMVAKYLERLGDHAVNICEWVEFVSTGVHNSAENIR